MEVDMPASKGRPVRDVSQGVIHFVDGTSVAIGDAAKNDLIAACRGRVRFAGRPPMAFGLAHIRSSLTTAAETGRMVTAVYGDQPATPRFPSPKATPEVTPAVPEAPKVHGPVAPRVASSTPPTAGIGAAIEAAVAAALAGGMDENRVRAIASEVTEATVEPFRPLIGALTDAIDAVDAKVDAIRPKVTEIVIPDRPKVIIKGVQHRVFPNVLRTLGAGLNVWMVGPAGTGKTTIAEQAAEALGLDFSSASFTSQTSQGALLGYQTATGNYVRTEFRERFEHGGVFLMDEVDNANPNILGVLNAALANGRMSFPDGMVKRHSNFVAVAAANTYGNGPTSEYVGRNPIDAATKDRFVFIHVPIDEAVEDAMVASSGCDAALAARWTVAVRKARANVEAAGLKHVVSPRAAFGGARLLGAGMPWSDVVEMTLVKGAATEQRTKILAGITA